MVSQRVWLSVWLRCTGGHHPLLLFGGAPPLSFLTVTSLKSMSPVQQRLPLRVSLRWDACATSRIAFTEQAVCPQAKCQQRRLIQEAHGRAPKRDGAGLSRTRGRASKVVRAMHALQAAAACGLPHGVLQGLPHFLAAHSSTHALSSSAERLLCHFIFLSIDRADRRAAWRSGRSF